MENNGNASEMFFRIFIVHKKIEWYNLILNVYEQF